MALTPVCVLSELTDGIPLRVEAEGLDIAVVKTAEGIFAIEDECSHAAVALSEGDVDGCTIECWLHGSRFDLRTGEALGPPATEPVPVFEVVVRGDDVLVDPDQPLEK